MTFSKVIFKIKKTGGGLYFLFKEIIDLFLEFSYPSFFLGNVVEIYFDISGSNY